MTGSQIKAWRQSLGLSRMELGLKLGISYFTIIKWETGRTNPSPLAQKQISKLLDEQKGKKKVKTVRLEDDTVGKVESGEVGDTVDVSLHDENGMPITVTGCIEEILEED